jgi:hypothetical protein
MRTETRPSEVSTTTPPVPRVRNDRFRMVSLAAAAPWIAVAAMSLFAPDMVTGASHDHLPIVAMTAWFWGAISTGLVVMAGAMGPGVADGRWRGLAIITAVIWAAVAVVTVMAPVLQTGSDPTEIPIAGLLAPVAGMVGTSFACLFVAGTARG